MCFWRCIIFHHICSEFKLSKVPSMFKKYKNPKGHCSHPPPHTSQPEYFNYHSKNVFFVPNPPSRQLSVAPIVILWLQTLEPPHSENLKYRRIPYNMIIRVTEFISKPAPLFLTHPYTNNLYCELCFAQSSGCFQSFP